MDAAMRLALVRQLGGSVEMLRQAIERCPDELWDNRDEGTPYWQVAYHAMYYFDLYHAESEASFSAPAFHVEPAHVFAGEYTFMSPPVRVDPPGFALPKASLLAYLDGCWERCQRRVGDLTEERAAARCGFEWYDMPVEELLLLNLRHVQHHTGQLAQTLRRRAGKSVGWVGRAEVVQARVTDRCET